MMTNWFCGGLMRRMTRKKLWLILQSRNIGIGWILMVLAFLLKPILVNTFTTDGRLSG